MIVETKSLDDLRDSSIMYNQTPPKFGFAFIIIISSFLILTFLWSMRTPKKFEIISHGTVTNEESNYVMCSYTGEVDLCNLKEGALVQKGDILLSIKSTDYTLQNKQLSINKDAYLLKVEKYRLLVQSIKDDVNYFNTSDDDDALYYNIFESLKAQIKQSTLDTRLYSVYGYSEEQIESELEKNQWKISQIYYDAISSAENAISEAELCIASIDAQLIALQSGQEDLVVRATESGVVHVLTDIKSGMMVQSTMPVATITPQNTESIIDAFISTEDMARIHLGDKVTITIDGLVQNVYGSLKGEIIQIDSDVSTREAENGMTQVFRVKTSMDANYLVSTSGDKIDIVNGMTAAVRINYDKLTYFEYFLEKIGLKLR